MAGTSLLALIDDIATILDDIALLTKLAAKKTTGVIGDDLALNAKQIEGINADRELPVVWAVAKGSLRNKLILVPSALAISAIVPVLIVPILMLGGVFLCYEGFEKLAHKYSHKEEEKTEEHKELVKALADPSTDIEAFEKEKITGAVKTDFVLSAEIITIALGTVAKASFGARVAVLSGIALLMTIVVYGFVACVVKLDDAGLYLTKRKASGFSKRFQHGLGNGLLVLAPYLMKFLSVAGTLAMFTVGGSIILHGIPNAAKIIHEIILKVSLVPGVGGAFKIAVPILIDIFAGVLVGALTLLVVKGPMMGKKPVEGKEI